MLDRHMPGVAEREGDDAELGGGDDRRLDPL
jgi:hypothetical protein